jgi:hypothetical protein
VDYAIHPIVALSQGGTAVLDDVPVYSGPSMFTSSGSMASPLSGGGGMSDQSVGTGDLTGVHNTPLHVGGILIAAVIVTILFKVTGFRFVVGANVASGVGKG